MANQNPIRLDVFPAEPVVFHIPAEHKDTMLYLTVFVKLKSKGWQFASFHHVILGKTDKFPSKIPEPNDVKLDYGKNLHGKKLFVQSHISRFRDGAPGSTPSIIDYKLKLEAGDVLIDEFTAESGTDNPSDFFSLIQFNQLP